MVPRPTTLGHELRISYLLPPRKERSGDRRGCFAGEPVPGDQNLAKIVDLTLVLGQVKLCRAWIKTAGERRAAGAAFPSRAAR